jgi:hypothetical protein
MFAPYQPIHCSFTTPGLLAMPLLPLDEIAAGPGLIQSYRPGSCAFALVTPDELKTPPVIWIGEYWPSGFTLSRMAVGVILEASRVGISLTTDWFPGDQSLKPVFLLPGAATGGGDGRVPMIKLVRFGDVIAGPDADWRPDAATRERFIKYAERTAEALRGSMWPGRHPSVADYAANLRSLLEAHDSELAGVAQPAE